MSTTDTIIFYADENCSGENIFFPVGTNIPDFNSYGMDDMISGVAVPPNTQVSLYIDCNYSPDGFGYTPDLIINNAQSSTTLKIDFTQGNIGKFCNSAIFEGWQMNNV